ncbi:uncharacterized protein LOC130892262 [Diorhabda carinulata]|uniref:uncharacterized protein LOC130892262 n=1 Tax=Diorhabda carinulata TaxID=1163345 RepID=UPI0025A09ECD|nr:uncharacterized protein LOC130892262 [Diorhabda carinulata]
MLTGTEPSFGMWCIYKKEFQEELRIYYRESGVEKLFITKLPMKWCASTRKTCRKNLEENYCAVRSGFCHNTLFTSLDILQEIPDTRSTRFCNPVVNINDNVDQKSNAEDGSFFVNTDNRQASENTFYPAFSPFQNQPLGHSRPIFFTQQDTAFSQRTPFQNNFDNSGRHSGYKDSYIFNNNNNNNNASPKPEQESILGSGNFGVITGGTFYSEKDENSKYGNYDSFSHNGHGKPAFYFTSQSKPQPYQQEQFANFKDFADINTQNDRQYSQYVVAYAPRENDTIERENRGEETVVTKPIPKNIIESLTLIDSEHITTIPEKKLSASKRKLAILKPEKKHLIKIIKKTKSRELEEPLLALS